MFPMLLIVVYWPSNVTKLGGLWPGIPAPVGRSFLTLRTSSSSGSLIASSVRFYPERSLDRNRLVLDRI